MKNHEFVSKKEANSMLARAAKKGFGALSIDRQQGEPVEQLGIVKNVGFGMRDCNEPVMWFDIRTLACGALMVFNLADARRFVEEAGCYDIKELEGCACVVATGGAGSPMTFLRWHK